MILTVNSALVINLPLTKSRYSPPSAFTKWVEVLARSSMRYDNLYSNVFQGPPTPLAAGIGCIGSNGLIGLA